MGRVVYVVRCSYPLPCRNILFLSHIVTTVICIYLYFISPIFIYLTYHFIQRNTCFNLLCVLLLWCTVLWILIALFICCTCQKWRNKDVQSFDFIFEEMCYQMSFNGDMTSTSPSLRCLSATSASVQYSYAHKYAHTLTQAYIQTLYFLLKNDTDEWIFVTLFKYIKNGAADYVDLLITVIISNISLAPSDLMTPYGDINVGHHRLR